MSSKKIKVGWIQGTSQHSPEKNLEYYSKKLKELSRADLVVLPELFLNDYFPIVEDKKNFDLALSLESKEIKHFTNLAKELEIVLILPFFEKSEKYFNSTLVIEKDGSVSGHYRKMHIPHDPGFYEKFYFEEGDKGYLICDTSVGKIGVLICFDQWFPEAARACALKGAELIVYPTAIGWDDKEPSDIYDDQLEAWININKSNAISNNVFTLAVNRVGKEGYLNFWGNSILTNPYGKALSRNGLNEEISSVEVDFSEVEKCRKVWTFMRDRRVDSYDVLLSS